MKRAQRSMPLWRVHPTRVPVYAHLQHVHEKLFAARLAAPRVPGMHLAAGFTLTELMQDSARRSATKGWHKKWNTPEKLMLVVTELAEAVEDYRVRKMKTVRGKKGKPEGFGSELADAFIRLADIAWKHRIDIDTEIRRKAAYNETRAFRHGGKRC